MSTKVDHGRFIIDKVADEGFEVDPYGFPQHAPGSKLDNGKVDWSLALWDAFHQCVAVQTYGATKYTRDGWRSVPDGVDRYQAALIRHFVAWKSGELIDPESNLPHLAHMMCNLAFIMELTKDGSK